VGPDGELKVDHVGTEDATAASDSDGTDQSGGATGPKHPIIVELAIMFHDAVYVPGSKQNEEDSVALFEKFVEDCSQCVADRGGTGMEDLLDEMEIAAVRAIILATKDHLRAVCPTVLVDAGFRDDFDIFLDLDLFVLARSRLSYLDYAHRVYLEYQNLVPPDVYCTKRAEFLRQLVDFCESGGRLYRSRLFRDEFHFRALDNVKYEIDEFLVRGHIPPPLQFAAAPPV
jgi:predicted metal-dependent HD superfamily phosphohydrolase